MTFAEFAQYLEQLEQTSSRLTLIDILSELFKVVKADEIDKVVYLIQGRVGPFSEAVEIGMSEKLVAASIARAYDTDKEKVLKEYAKVGDLGKVASQLASHPEREKRAEGSLAVNEVFDTLTEIAKTTGAGTVEKRINLLAGLLRVSDPISAKHLARIPMGSSRLGVGDPTILDAFAQAKLGDRKKRKILETAYNRTSDLGLIGKTLWEKGEKGITSLGVMVGRPIRSQLAERLPDAKTILEKMGGEVHVQYKYDGFRVQIHKDGDKVRLFSRNLEETTSMFPDLCEGAEKQIKAKSAIFDSEALAYNPDSEEFLPFQETTKRRRKYDIDAMAKKLPLRAFVFDILYFDGKPLIDLPLVERIAYLKKALKEDDVLIPQPGEVTKSVERIEELFNESLTKGLEGLVTKRPDSKYEAGARNFNWVKLKRHSAGELHDTIDCVILGYIFGKGKRSGFGAGSLLVGVYDDKLDEFVTVSKIGTGLTDEEWKEIKVKSEKFKVQSKPARVNSLITPTVWVQPKIVIEVLADEVTKSPTHTAGLRDAQAKVKSGEKAMGYALRFPRLVKFRSDKKPEEATTVKELLEMYKDQFKKI
ncbi:DNA ligase [Candidatus Daviesbacteria bacterium RIFOXYD1_FULL_41_10]|uniref:Probable DNA ligase n=1 Tax=Candidatus Daviesbacteria bacterium RIFOXYD1_FULL_41_10 TaxID=1797801 RepID=A0A1F5N158_9BACT|nr:MAG: DNA ligase [Candidatus Daviesbacteria bacterium RIFOXYD1_FULL_41_10]